MMARQRDYHQERARRYELARLRNLTPSQREGHPRKGEKSVTELRHTGRLATERPGTVERYYATLRNIGSGQSLAAASRRARISPTTVHRLDEERAALYKTYREGSNGHNIFDRWGITASAPFPLLAAGDPQLHRLHLDEKNRSIVGGYWSTVEPALRDRDQARIADVMDRFSHITVYDINGQAYRLETDPNAIIAFYSTMDSDERTDFYRLFGSEKVPVRR